MSLLGWLCVLAVTVAAVLFGQTARSPEPSTSRRPTRVRIGVGVSITGPLLVAAVGLTVAVVNGNWLTVAVGTVAAIIATAALGVMLAP